MTTNSPHPARGVYNAVMLDMEFLDVRPTAAILAIAMVPMNTDTLEVGEGWKLNVDADDCIRRGMTVSASTIQWWANQDARAFADAFEKDAAYRHPLEVALFKVSQFFDNIAPKDTLKVWQCGSLDADILTHAYDRIHKPPLFNFWAVRDFRTLREEFPRVPYQASGVPHKCLDDALNQANHLMAILTHIRGAKPQKTAVNNQQSAAPKRLADLDDDI